VEEAHRRAAELKERARRGENVDFIEVNAAIERELARTKAIKRWRKIKNIE
jgi:hypothetical protein